LTFKNIFFTIQHREKEWILRLRSAKSRRRQMKFIRLSLLLALLMTCLIASTCVNSGDDPDDPDPANLPNFVKDACAGCPDQVNIGNVTGITFFSYVKNIGGAGKISMTIGTTGNTTTQQFDVTAGTSYIFQASVHVEKLTTATFTYSAKFPGTAGYTDTRTVTGYHHTGAPFNLRMDPK
jgi:hypothetical protein